MPRSPLPPAQRQLLLQMVEEVWQMPNWNDTSLQSTLRRVSAEMAAWRPPFCKRSIADITVHCAYWKYALQRRLNDAPRGGFPFKGSNWFKLPETLPDERWREYKNLLADQHEALVAAIKSFRPSEEDYSQPQDKKWTATQKIFWLAIHDGYHTGQINQLKAMYRRAHK